MILLDLKHWSIYSANFILSEQVHHSANYIEHLSTKLSGTKKADWSTTGSKYSPRLYEMIKPLFWLPIQPWNGKSLSHVKAQSKPHYGHLDCTLNTGDLAISQYRPRLRHGSMHFIITVEVLSVVHFCSCLSSKWHIIQWISSRLAL